MVDALPYGRQSISDDDIEAVVAQLKSDWLTQGPAVAQFEGALTEITGAKYAVAVSSGTAALHLVCLALGVESGDVGVTSDVTFVASANAIRYAGGKPSLVDVDPTTGLISVDALSRTVDQLAESGCPPRVIIPVDLAGAVADLPGVRAIADRVGAKVVEDAAHSLGATFVHEGVTHSAADCRFAEAAILSFHPVKHITTGEGGAITTNDSSTYESLLSLRTHGITKDSTRLEQNDGPWYYEQQTLGFNYRLTDLQCALGTSQARRFPTFLARRRELARLYDDALHRLASDVEALRVPSGVRSAYHLYVIRLVRRANETLETLRGRRLALFMHLRARGIFTQIHYIPVHRQPDFVRHGYSAGSFAGADEYYAGCISLPMFPAMADTDVTRVVTAIAEGMTT